MNKAEIKLTRIDNRLVHGQVGVTWVNSIGVDTIVVIDDEVAVNIMRQKLMASIAHASNVQIRFYSVDNFVEVFNNTESCQKLYLVVHNPVIVRRLVEKGIKLENINLGNMHYEKGKVAFNRKMYLSEDDIDAINFLVEQGINMYYQDVPGSLSEKIEKLDYELLKKRR